MSAQEFRPGKKVLVAAVATVAATYAYFLLFAQFGFLKALLAATGGESGAMKPVLAVMGLAGISASMLAAKVFTPERSRRLLAAGFGISAAAAGLLLSGGPRVVYYFVALLVGAGCGLTTVTLASVLRRALGGERLGTVIGFGTGLAYAFCNLPAIFNAGPAMQAAVSLLICGVGALAATGLDLRAPEAWPTGFDYSRTGMAIWVLVFFTLVFLDSAAFYIIQHTPVIKAATWSGGWRLEVNAGMHLVAAVLAGSALDRRWVGRTILAAAALLVTACLLMDASRRAMAEGALCYTAGVSVYSAALVFYPARSLRPKLAALVYAVAGWGGSALGIGFAENLHRVPSWFIAAAAGVLLAAMVVRRRLARRRAAMLVAGLVLFGGNLATPGAEAAESPLIAQGRAVFISEGCIHCHSQFVRPGTGDEGRWGPVQPLDAVLAQRPPLLGNRRQGPDLENVGNRRNPEWNRLHLIAPRLITPGSRMPSYVRLFEPGRPEGAALLAYLASLGDASAGERWESNQRWQPQGSAHALSAGEAARLFGQWCAACHGAGGRGDGPAAARLANRPRNLVEDRWRYVAGGNDPVAEQLALARLIKFGVPGTAMAGHEYLDDDAVLSLVAHLQTLRAKK